MLQPQSLRITSLSRASSPSTTPLCDTHTHMSYADFGWRLVCTVHLRRSAEMHQASVSRTPYYKPKAREFGGLPLPSHLSEGTKSTRHPSGGCGNKLATHDTDSANRRAVAGKSSLLVILAVGLELRLELVALGLTAAV